MVLLVFVILIGFGGGSSLVCCGCGSRVVSWWGGSSRGCGEWV